MQQIQLLLAADPAGKFQIIAKAQRSGLLFVFFHRAVACQYTVEVHALVFYAGQHLEQVVRALVLAQTAQKQQVDRPLQKLPFSAENWLSRMPLGNVSQLVSPMTCSNMRFHPRESASTQSALCRQSRSFFCRSGGSS